MFNSNELVSDFLVPQLISGVRSIDFLAFAVQVLANSITLNEQTQKILWPQLFPSVFRYISILCRSINAIIDQLIDD